MGPFQTLHSMTSIFSINHRTIRIEPTPKRNARAQVPSATLSQNGYGNICQRQASYILFSSFTDYFAYEKTEGVIDQPEAYASRGKSQPQT